ncbi:MAG: ribonuclease III [Candidatus Improbicoccus devescovinae]|nr:MAG: ribonuclease III [Candidatus Improbicoccus devescovinae]
MHGNEKIDLLSFERNLGYDFNDKKKLINALTHSSFANEFGSGENYERLEFLGDSIIEFVTSEYIYVNFPQMPEGDLTRLRAALVCKKTLKKFSILLEVGKYLRLSHGEQRGGGRERSSILADVFESVIAAVYLDSGIEQAKKIIIKFISNEIQNSDEDFCKDYKTEIQEIVQVDEHKELCYELINVTGPDHDKFFTVELIIDGKKISQGIGKSKKEAEQQAAKQAVMIINSER